MAAARRTDSIWGSAAATVLASSPYKSVHAFWTARTVFLNIECLLPLSSDVRTYSDCPG
jgi:hypothetical protein